MFTEQTAVKAPNAIRNPQKLFIFYLDKSKKKYIIR